MEEPEAKEQGFTIQNSGTEFANKSKDIFGGLDALASKHEAFQSSRKDESYKGWKTDPSTEDTQTIMPAFKQPQGIPHKRDDHRGGSGRSDRERDVSREVQHRNREWDNRRGWDRNKGRDTWRGTKRRFQTPDHKLHPEKYTKYSLEDVSSEDMSNASNTKAALAFLEERRKLREGEMKEDVVDTSANACSKGMFVFAKKSTISKDSSVRPSKQKDKLSRKIDISCDDINHSGQVRKSGESCLGNHTSLTEDKETVSESDSKEDRTSFKSRKKFGSRNIRRKEHTDSDED
ncbi:hypothetical protein FSP39_013716 [Pinctada imbricata]|uniref:U5 small nuclear ribonucleoprotein TSSC4 n=1 Tax=Pinctada imbricata TaxID=66713 RepID=A0AA88YP85_PINIB|nr:hypothetical protein FSP39_013716 [Pinctada imbricata]